MKDGTIDVEMGIPVNNALEGKGDILAGTYPQSKVATTDYFGFYDNLGKAHSDIQQWLIEMNLQVQGSPMEQYITDPASEPDTAKWLTKIYYPVG
ncbi:MAG: GyrI-like domain-containing protein [Bacteroidales bacterium]|nr:GyrI-like domain-containing protein [Bacteroidales bacterium]